MAALIETKCRRGTLTITDQYIRLTIGKHTQRSLARSSLTGIDSVKAVASLFGIGGAVTLTFHGQGEERLRAEWINPGMAKEIMSLLGY